MLFIAIVDVEITQYMQEGQETRVDIIPVEALDEKDAYDLLDEHYKDQTESYYRYTNYSVRVLQPTLSRQTLKEENGSGNDWSSGSPGA